MVSGTPEAVRQASELLTARGATVRALRVPRAFHSPLMAPVAHAVSDAARRLLKPSAPALAVMSTLTAQWQPRLDPDHLREHALRPVLSAGPWTVCWTRATTRSWNSARGGPRGSPPCGGRPPEAPRRRP
ncbi:hypothetical protein ACR6C2_44520 [Streptomyces sp. INA 01156]